VDVVASPTTGTDLVTGNPTHETEKGELMSIPSLPRPPFRPGSRSRSRTLGWVLGIVVGVVVLLAAIGFGVQMQAQHHIAAPAASVAQR
jgi:hypothetical protein